ncbi:MAG: amidase, partial [Eubacteriales bacterium]
KRIELLETINALKTGDLDLLSFINDLCDRIDAVEPHILSLIPEEGKRERLKAEAKALLAQYPDQLKRPPLFGLPVGIKDIFRVDGFETGCGSKLLPTLFEGKEATIVTQLKEKGALILGKTVTTEFAYFQPGPTKNPNNIDFTPGGSSSGSAAAVAAGLTPLAFGTQTIGSISRPAAFCGVIGVKPSSQSISTNGIIPFSPTLDHVGYFSHDLEGAGLIASLFCEEWNKSDNEDINEITIGIPGFQFITQPDSNIFDYFNFNVVELENRGYKIIRTSVFSDIEKINTLHKQLTAKEFADTHKEWFAQYANMYSPHSVQLIEEGLKVTPEFVNEILNYRQVLINQVNETMEKEGINVWISPATLTLPPQGLTSTGSPLMNLPWTFTGLPTITLPMENTSMNLPIGLQFTGKMNGLKNLFGHIKNIKEKLQ